MVADLQLILNFITYSWIFLQEKPFTAFNTSIYKARRENMKLRKLKRFGRRPRRTSLDKETNHSEMEKIRNEMNIENKMMMQ